MKIGGIIVSAEPNSVNTVALCAASGRMSFRFSANIPALADCIQDALERREQKQDVLTPETPKAYILAGL